MTPNKHNIDVAVTRIIINSSNEIVLLLDVTDDIGTKAYRVNFTKWAEAAK